MVWNKASPKAITHTGNSDRLPCPHTFLLISIVANNFKTFTPTQCSIFIDYDMIPKKSTNSLSFAAYQTNKKETAEKYAHLSWNRHHAHENGLSLNDMEQVCSRADCKLSRPPSLDCVAIRQGHILRLPRQCIPIIYFRSASSVRFLGYLESDSSVKCDAFMICLPCEHIYLLCES